MAPQPTGGVAKRKRANDTTAAKDNTKKLDDSKNKRIKQSGDGKVPPKKGPSDAPPVAPLAVSSLKSGKEEKSFPRGGGSVLTPLEYKEITNKAVKDVLFETSAASKSKPTTGDDSSDVEMADASDKKVKQKKRKPEHSKKGKKGDAKEAEDTGPKVEGLSFKRITPGSIVLGCVIQINSTDIALSLPNNLIGYVPITSVSEKLTSRIEAMIDADEDDEEDGAEDGKDDTKGDLTNLNNYFRIGQYLRACVISSGEDVPDKANKKSTSAEHTKHKKRIELSLQPSMTNSGLTSKELVSGCAIQASVTSVEDHGLIMELGLEDKSITGFMSSKELGEGLKLSEVQEGQVLLCTITGMATSGKVVKLSGEPEKPVGAKKGKGGTWKGGLWLSEAPTIDAFTPGTAVEMLVTDVGRNGGLQGYIMGSLDCVVDYFHAYGWGEKSLEDRVKVGSKINARVLFTNPNSEPRKLNLSILPHILTLSTPSSNTDKDLTKVLPIATIIETAKVIKVESKLGLFIDSGVPGVPGYVHISRISDKKVEDLSATIGAYKLGSVHRARVVGYNPVDGLFICSMEERVLDQKYLRLEDVKVGEVVKGTIKKLLPSGSLIVELSEGITALVEEIHLSDVKLKNPEKKFREGMTVTGRILLNDSSKKNLRMTLKKTLVNSDAPIITSYETAVPGMQTPGTLVTVIPAGAVVKFYSDITAFLPASEMSEAYIQDPREHFRIGQSVNVNVVNVDVENEKMRVSCRDPKAFGEAQEKALKQLQPGQIVSGIVVEKSNDDLVLEIQNIGADGIKGVLLMSQLVDGSKQKATQAFRNMRAGQTLKDVLVLGKVEAKRLITLTLKPSLVNAAKEGQLIRGVEDVQEGKVCHGFVSNITLHNIIVSFPGGAAGAIPKYEIPADKVSLPDFGVARSQSITATVCRIDHEKQRFLLTLKPYDGPKPTANKDGNKTRADKKKATGPILKPVDETIQSIDEFVPGKVTKAKIISVKDTQVNVQLAENVHGRIDVSQLFETWTDIKNKKRPMERFKKDQILDVKIIGAHDPRNHRFLAITHRQSSVSTIFELSAKSSVIKSKDSTMLSFDQLREGQNVIAFVNNHSDDCVWVNLSPTVRGKIKLLDLSDDAGMLSDLNKSFPIGSAIKCTVLHVDANKNQLDLTARANAKPMSFESVEKGMIIPARVTKINDRQVMLQLSETVSGVISLTDIADDFSLAQTSKFSKNEIIRVCVLDVDKTNKRISLSSRPSRVLSSSSPVKDPEVFTLANLHLGDVRRGFIKNITDKGIFVFLGGNVTAFVPISDISDQYVKDWKSAVKVDQLVKGKVTGIEEAVGQVKMSLKHSIVESTAKPQIQLGDLEVGQIVKGTIRSSADYGVFVVVDGSANVSGLCHKSEISDKLVKDVKKLYAPGDQVKAKILSIDLETKKISFGLKASYFENLLDDEDEADDMAHSGDEDSEGGVDLSGAIDVESADESDKEANDADSDEEMVDAPASSGTGLSTSGFDWTGSIMDAKSTADNNDSDDSDADSTHADRKKKKSQKSKIKQDLTGELNTRAPESVSDFERLLMGNPQSGELWVRYMAFQLQLSEVDKAREIAERALKTITSVTKEKEIIWAAMLNLELEYGTDESLDEVFKRACVYNDSYDMHEKLCNIYIQAGKFEQADALFQSALKKHGSTTPALWSTYAAFLHSQAMSAPDRARSLLPRALQILPKDPPTTHRALISKFAQLEFTHGDPERGRTLFESLLATFPGKLDLLVVWTDMEIKVAKAAGDGEGVRALLRGRLGKDSKVKPKVAKSLFKKWMEFEESGVPGAAGKKGVEEVQRRAREFAEAVAERAKKVDKDRMELIEGDAE